jgi:hypothetical protein
VSPCQELAAAKEAGGSADDKAVTAMREQVKKLMDEKASSLTAQSKLLMEAEKMKKERLMLINKIKEAKATMDRKEVLRHLRCFLSTR